jgi:hypothetical protein
VTIDQRRHREFADNVDPSADQREIFFGEIDHPRRLRDAPVEPGFHRVAVGRCNVDWLSRHQRANVGVSDAIADQVRPRRRPEYRCRAAGDDRCDGDRGSERPPGKLGVRDCVRGRRMPTAVSTRMRRPGGGASRGRCSRIRRCRASTCSHSAASAESVAIRFSTASCRLNFVILILSNRSRHFPHSNA